MKNKRMLGNAILLLTAIIWGSAFVFQRQGMDHIEPITFSAVRNYLSAAALACIVAVSDAMKKKNGSFPVSSMSPEEFAAYKKNTLIGGLCCGVCLTGGTIFQQMGLVYTTAGKAGFLTAMYMFLVPIVSVVFMKKKLGWAGWLGVVMGTFGMYLLSIKGDFTINKGDGLVMICGCFFTLHILACDHFGSGADTLRVSMIQFLTTAVLATILSFIFETPTWEKVLSAWFPIVFCSLFSGAMGYTLQIIGQKYAEPAVASLLLSMESVFAALSGWLFLNERMSLRELIGCAVMFIAIIIVQLPPPEKKSA